MEEHRQVEITLPEILKSFELKPLSESSKPLT